MDNNTFEGHVPPPPATSTESDTVFAEVRLRTMDSDLASIRQNGGVVKMESVPIKVDAPKKPFKVPTALVWTIVGVVAMGVLFLVGFYILPNIGR